MKYLLKSQQDYIDLAIKELDNPKSNFGSCEEIEKFFGLQFGTDKQCENGIVSTENIQIKNQELHPEHYPCIMVFINESEYDRLGTFQVQFCEYIYLTDFNDS